MTPTCPCGRPTTGTTLCHRCATTLAHALVNTGLYWHHARTPTNTRQIGGGTPALTVDGRTLGGVATMPATQILWDTWNTLTTWARVILEENPPTAGPTCGEPCLHVTCAHIRRTQPPGNHVTAITEYLARHHHWILTRRWADQMLDELCDTERRLRWLVDIPAPRWYAGRCGATTTGHASCDAELYAAIDRGTVTCQRCGTSHDIADRRDTLLDEAADQLVTATEAASALAAWTDYDGNPGRLARLISTWQARARLTPRGTLIHLGRQRNTYRFGDIQTLLVEHMQHHPRTAVLT